MNVEGVRCPAKSPEKRTERNDGNEHRQNLNVERVVIKKLLRDKIVF